MEEVKKSKKASEEQKEFLLLFMEENLDFAQDRFESGDAAQIKNQKWRELGTKLNSLGGATKDANQWRKYWRDQKLHAKEREILVKASMERGVKKTKALSPFEERLLSLLVVPADISETNIPELFSTGNSEEDTRCLDHWTTTASTLKQTNLLDTKDDLGPETYQGQEFSSTNTFQQVPATAKCENVPTFQTSNKRKKAPSGAAPEIAYLVQNILKIDREKLAIKKKTFAWRSLYEKQLLQFKEKEAAKNVELRERELCLKEKELVIKEKELSAKEKELEIKERELSIKEKDLATRL